MDAAEEVAADELLGDGLEVVGEDHHVVAVPAHAAADVQQDLVEARCSTAEILSAIDLGRDGSGRRRGRAASSA